jgi:predicted glycosyltransferase involved in capsule biosynthesis
MTNIIVIVPYRPDHGHRDQLWAHLKDNYWAHQPYEIVVGEDMVGPFNRAKAVNQAAEIGWDIAIIADTDTWVPAKQLHRAILTAKVTNRLVAAFDAVVEINRQTTIDILNGKTGLAGSFGADKVRTRTLETQSSMLVITRNLWDQVGGMDQRFHGWGCEDNAFWHACAIHAGEPERISGNAYHLWHPSAPGKFAGIAYKRNLNLWRKYERARTVEDLQAI